MAKLAAFMAGNGALGDKTIMSAHTAQVAQGNPTEKQDTLLRETTKFTTGGWAVFDTDFGCNRQGSIGWFGIGGSVLMWHPELKVSDTILNIHLTELLFLYHGRLDLPTQIIYSGHQCITTIHI
jgi:hypothetical protein